MKYHQLLDAFKDWYQEWPFTVFLTLTKPHGTVGWRNIPANIDNQLSSYRKRFENKYGSMIGLLGIATLSKAGYLHLHLLGIKENCERFSRREIAALKRNWPHNAEVEEITNLNRLIEYLISKRHLIWCRTFENMVTGEILKSLKGAKIKEI